MKKSFLTFLLIIITVGLFCSCCPEEKEIYENVYLYQHSNHYSLKIKSGKEKHEWICLVIDSLYSDNGQTIFMYGLGLRSNAKGWHYVTDGPNYKEGGELPDVPYSKELHTITGKSLKYHKLISVDKLWNEN